MKHITPERLGAKLKHLREAVDMEQEIVAKVLGIPRTAVTAIEQGRRDVTVIEFVQLCKIFRVPPNDMLDWNAYRTRKPAPSEPA